jgi:hypothetical protein
MKRRLLMGAISLISVFGLCVIGCVTTEGKKDTPAKYFLYDEWRGRHADNHEVYIKGYIGEDTDVVIPEKINGGMVTRIEAGAFANRSDITSITIPFLRGSIEKTAFEGCTNLTGISFGGSHSGGHNVMVNGLNLIFKGEYTKRNGDWFFYSYSSGELPVAKMSIILNGTRGLHIDINTYTYLSMLNPFLLLDQVGGAYVLPGVHTLQVRYSSSTKDVWGTTTTTASQGTSTLTVDMSAGSIYEVYVGAGGRTVTYSIKEVGRTQL